MRYQNAVRGASQVKVIGPPPVYDTAYFSQSPYAQPVVPNYVPSGPSTIPNEARFLQTSAESIRAGADVVYDGRSYSSVLSGRGIGMSCAQFAALSREQAIGTLESAAARLLFQGNNSWAQAQLDQNKLRLWLDLQYSMIMAQCAQPQAVALVAPAPQRATLQSGPYGYPLTVTPNYSMNKGYVDPYAYQTAYGYTTAENPGFYPGKQALRPAGQAMTTGDMLWSAVGLVGTVGGIWFLSTKLMGK